MIRGAFDQHWLYPAPPDGWRDTPARYYASVLVPADARLRDQPIVIDYDGDFLWRAMNSRVAPITGDGVFCTLRFADPLGYRLSSDLVPWQNFFTTNTPQVPYVLDREIRIPAGGTIYFDLNERESEEFTFQLLLLGVKRRRIC